MYVSFAYMSRQKQQIVTASSTCSGSENGSGSHVGVGMPESEVAGSKKARTISSTPSDWEPWEGCLVTISDVEVTTDDDGYGGVELDNGLIMDDLLYSHGASSGDTFSEITGLITYAYSAWRINPRSGDL